jgi:GTP-binding protein
MEVRNVTLEAVAVSKKQYPESGLPEVSFVGRSNVGKSSLINSMINRKALARTSKTPGKTRTINFYNVENLLYFVDLPGYGYAKISRSESEKWGEMIEGYLKERKQLKAIILLIDMRHEPTANDKMMYEWLKHYEYTVIIVATKSDKINRGARDKHYSIIRKGLGLKSDDLLIGFSSETKDGKDKLWEAIEAKIKG